MTDQKFGVWLYWEGGYALATHQRCPTTGPQGSSWLLSVPSGPDRPSLNNLIHPSSPGWAMLMRALVRTPIQHELRRSSNPTLKPSNQTCLQVAELQELANAPGNSNRSNSLTGEKLMMQVVRIRTFKESRQKGGLIIKVDPCLV